MSSPNDIEVMIHFYCTTSPHPRADAPAVKDAIKRFLAAGLIEGSGNGYAPTDGGEKFVKALCAIPWPVQEWVIPKAGLSKTDS